ncbi:hypothetical protein QTG54_013982 [Skeletonema marinoi]|uniref:Uncharacterized protein n=1 Tax=Skeletonema marinoi TaxID=267567 RepID=A0AAD8XX88_9STRA|nr:hypothetical protein QTG54_013982 [Skeletonema marinoi]
MFLTETSSGFMASTSSVSSMLKIRHNFPILFMEESNNSSDENDADSESSDTNKENVVIEDLSWRVAKARLEEEASKRSFLKRKPLKLSYEQSQKWIQRNWAIKTEEEFNDLVANGNLRTPYISKRPEEYYGERGEWISWDHYLTGNCTDSIAEGRQSKWQ